MDFYHLKSLFKCFVSIMTTFCLILSCSGPKSQSGGSSQLSQAKALFPTINSIEPQSSVTVNSTGVYCIGECTVILADSNYSVFESVNCDGDLTINNGSLVCSNNLSLIK